MKATPAKVDEKLKKELITILLKVYMSGRCVSPLIVGGATLSFSSRNSEPSIDKASRLLNTQAMNLDALEVARRGSGKPRRFCLFSHVLDPFDDSARLPNQCDVFVLVKIITEVATHTARGYDRQESQCGTEP